MGIADWWKNLGRDYNRFPSDENGDVLWMMKKSGDDLSKARRMDFCLIFPSRELADQFGTLVGSEGFQVEVDYFEEKQVWDVQCSKHMVPNHGQVTEVEEHLSRLAAPYKGKADGWGSYAQ